MSRKVNGLCRRDWLIDIIKKNADQFEIFPSPLSDDGSPWSEETYRFGGAMVAYHYEYRVNPPQKGESFTVSGIDLSIYATSNKPFFAKTERVFITEEFLIKEYGIEDLKTFLMDVLNQCPYSFYLTRKNVRELHKLYLTKYHL